MDTRPTVNRLYELIHHRINEIEKEILKEESELVRRHLQKMLDHNKIIMLNLLKQEPHIERYH